MVHILDQNGTPLLQETLEEPGMQYCFTLADTEGLTDLNIQILALHGGTFLIDNPTLHSTCTQGVQVANVMSTQDYYPFGMVMPGRNYQGAEGYRYGFNGKEMDNEVSGNGNQYDYGFRIYNPRLGRFLSVDPLTKDYPFYTPYQFASNTLMVAIDLDGLESIVVINSPWFIRKMQEEKLTSVNDKELRARMVELMMIAISVPRPEDKPGSQWVKNAYHGEDYVGTTTSLNPAEDPRGFLITDYDGNEIFSYNYQPKVDGVDEPRKVMSTLSQNFWDIEPSYSGSDIKEQAGERLFDFVMDIGNLIPLGVGMMPISIDLTGKINRSIELEIKGRLRTEGAGAGVLVPTFNGNNEVMKIDYFQYNVDDDGNESFDRRTIWDREESQKRLSETNSKI